MSTNYLMLSSKGTSATRMMPQYSTRVSDPRYMFGCIAWQKIQILFKMEYLAIYDLVESVCRRLVVEWHVHSKNSNKKQQNFRTCYHKIINLISVYAKTILGSLFKSVLILTMVFCSQIFFQFNFFPFLLFSFSIWHI